MNRIENENFKNYEIYNTMTTVDESSFKDISVKTNVKIPIVEKDVINNNIKNPVINNKKTRFDFFEINQSLPNKYKTDSITPNKFQNLKKDFSKKNYEKIKTKKNDPKFQKNINLLKIEKLTPNNPKKAAETCKNTLNKKFTMKKNFNPQNLENLKKYYDNYLEIIQTPTDPKLLKRTFEDYMKIVNAKYIQKVTPKTCKKLDQKYIKPNFKNLTLDKSHKPVFLKELDSGYYVFFKIIDFIWKHKKVLKKDLKTLTPCKIFILRSLIKRKFGEEIDFRSGSKMKEHLNLLKFKISEKRNEENLKFLLKKVFKFLQTFKFSKSQNLDVDIYEEYFKGIMAFEFFEKNFISVNRTKKIVHLKKINSSIISLILKSEKFVSILKLYCEDFLMKEYSYEISWKIFVLVKKWKKQSEKMDVNFFKKICDYIENNKQFKLPWTVGEVETGVQFLHTYFKNKKIGIEF